MSVESLLCNDDGSGSSCLEPAETLDVESADGTNPTYKRVIRSQSVIHDADKVMLATLEAVELDLLTGNAKDRHTAKLNKLRSKVNLFVARAAAAANTVAAKKARVNFEMEDVMRLCHSRTLQEHQFRDKAINSGNTKLALVAGSYNDGFTALPKGGYGAALGPGEIAVIYGPLPEARRLTPTQLSDKFRKLCNLSREIMLKSQPDALKNAAAFKVQGKGEKSDMSPFDAMASVLEDIELLKKKQPFHEQMVLFGWATSMLISPPDRTSADSRRAHPRPAGALPRAAANRRRGGGAPPSRSAAARRPRRWARSRARSWPCTSESDPTAQPPVPPCPLISMRCARSRRGPMPYSVKVATVALIQSDHEAARDVYALAGAARVFDRGRGRARARAEHAARACGARACARARAHARCARRKMRGHARTSMHAQPSAHSHTRACAMFADADAADC